MRSIVYNLLSSALRYPPPTGVQSRVVNAYLVLTVQDNGLGIDLTRARQQFTMFYRFHTHVEGSGLGLYMVKKMVENAGGKIEVESKLGEGTAFSVYLRHVASPI